MAIAPHTQELEMLWEELVAGTRVEARTAREAERQEARRKK
jgi:hypothetical protein